MDEEKKPITVKQRNGEDFIYENLMGIYRINDWKFSVGKTKNPDYWRIETYPEGDYFTGGWGPQIKSWLERTKAQKED